LKDSLDLSPLGVVRTELEELVMLKFESLEETFDKLDKLNLGGVKILDPLLDITV
jgi:hypothetical protein